MKKSEIKTNRKVESEDIFQGYLLELTINYLFHFTYFKAVEKNRIDEVRHFIRDVNRRDEYNSTPLIRGK